MAEYKPETEDLKKFVVSDDVGETKPINMKFDNDGEPNRVDILDFGDEGFLLKNLLSISECAHMISEGERVKFDQIPEAKTSYRNCQRLLVRSKELADELWERVSPSLRPFTIDGDPHKVHIHGVETLLQGTWEPAFINDLFRFCRYQPGGHFAPHFDGHFVKSPDLRSMKTIMLYLNGDFEGGTTNFVNESQTLYMNEDNKYCAEEKNILHRIKPESGMGILFNHHRLHEGQALMSGVKYILRSDIMYKRVGDSNADPKEAEAFQIVQEAERLEAIGETMSAMKLYRSAFKMSPAVAAAYGCPE